MNPILTKNFNREVAVAPYRFAMLSTADNLVVAASAATDKILGVSVPGDLPGRVDICLVGIAEIECGGVVTRGDQLTSNADGKGIALSDAMLAANVCRAGGIAMMSGVSGDIIRVLVLQQRASKYDALTSSAAEINSLHGKVAGATIVVGAENAGTGVINVAIQLIDANGADLAMRACVMSYLSNDANGDSVVAPVHSGAVAIGTDGLLLPMVAKTNFMLTSEADGDIDINITEAGAKTAYLVLVMPNGSLVVSGAITHAA
jgi:hypothetical protein